MTQRLQRSDVKRASFQYDGHFALYRHITGTAGVKEYREESFRGETIDSVVDSKRSFEAYVATRINIYLKALVDA